VCTKNPGLPGLEEAILEAQKHPVLDQTPSHIYILTPTDQQLTFSTMFHHSIVSAMQEHAQKLSRDALKTAYLAVNSSKLSSWLVDASCPSLSVRRMLLVLKLLADPEVANRAGTA
jgi:hypothetical protein